MKGTLGELGWGLAWLLACIYLIFDPEPLFQLFRFFSGTPADDSRLEIFFLSILFGCLGSVVALFRALIRDRLSGASPPAVNPTQAYWLKPFRGLGVGAIVGGVLIVSSLGLIGVTSVTLGLGVFVSFIAGNHEDWVSSLIRKILSRLWNKEAADPDEVQGSTDHVAARELGKRIGRSHSLLAGMVIVTTGLINEIDLFTLAASALLLIWFSTDFGQRVGAARFRDAAQIGAAIGVIYGTALEGIYTHDTLTLIGTALGAGVGAVLSIGLKVLLESPRNGSDQTNTPV